jgi:NAD(P)-dependent dehydrogenase (short-subunit alcohol dehydrogenase family)
VRLLLDVHHSPAAAERLRQLGHDVVAAAASADLARLTDDDLLRAASAGGRALVTENAQDFDRIVRAFAAAGEHHAGVVFTSPRRFHRGSLAYPENLVEALGTLLAGAPAGQLDWIHWLN